MINRKTKKVICKMAGIMGLLMLTSFFSIPVDAEENRNVNTENLYNYVTLEKEALNNNVIEQNGAKLTVTDIIASKNRIKIKMDFEADSSKLEEIMNGSGRDYLDISTSLGNLYDCDYGESRSYAGNGKIKIERELQNRDGFKNKDILRIDAVCGILDLNGSLKIPVDFTEDFNKIFTKDINIKADKVDAQIERFESNPLETSIVISQPEDSTMSFKHSISSDILNFLVDVDGELYFAEYPAYSDIKNGREYDNYSAQGLSYDKVEKAENISIMQISNNMSDEELDAFYNTIEEDDYKGIKNEYNIKIPQNIKFSDGTNGAITAVKEDGKVKAYCKADSDLKSLIMALNLGGFYGSEDDETNGLLEKGTIKKDKEADNQYIVEFDNVENDKDINLYVSAIIYNSDRYSLGEEIKIK